MQMGGIPFSYIRLDGRAYFCMNLIPCINKADDDDDDDDDDAKLDNNMIYFRPSTLQRRTCLKKLLYPQCAWSNELYACAFQYIGPRNWREIEATW